MSSRPERLRRRDPQLCDRTRYTIDPESAFPKYYSGTLEIRVKDGRTLRHTERVNRGHPENPLSRQDVIDKFGSTASKALSGDKLQQVIETTLSLERQSSVLDFLGPLVAVDCGGGVPHRLDLAQQSRIAQAAFFAARAAPPA